MNRSSTLTQDIKTLPTVLKLGDTGLPIRDLQAALNKRLSTLGMLERMFVQVDGIFGPQTRNSVKYLQCVGGLPVDGVVGDRTGLFIFEGASGLPLVSQGYSGTLVVAVQQAILAAHIRVKADGIFGPSTERALKAYQTKLGLVADGIVGPRTWDTVVRSRAEGIPCVVLLPQLSA